MAIADTVRDLSELFASQTISAIRHCGVIRAENTSVAGHRCRAPGYSE
jgi:hypothetical protein